jgi:hypothetical protein
MPDGILGQPFELFWNYSEEHCNFVFKHWTTLSVQFDHGGLGRSVLRVHSAADAGGLQRFEPSASALNHSNICTFTRRSALLQVRVIPIQDADQQIGLMGALVDLDWEYRFEAELK